MTSTSSYGSSIHHPAVHLDLNIRMSRAGSASVINGASNCCRRDYPIRRSTAKSILLTRRFSPWRFTSNSLPLSKVEDLTDTTLAQKISQSLVLVWSASAADSVLPWRIQANPTHWRLMG